MINKLRVAVAGVLTVVTLAGCADAYEDFEPAWTPTGTRPTASFDASVAPRTEVALDIRYTLRNQGTEPIVAYIGLDDGHAMRPYDVYVTVRKDGTVELAKRTFAVPPGVDLDGIPGIEGVTVPPGEEVTEEFSVPLPLEGNRPFGYEVELPDPVRDVVFCLGAVLQREALAPKRAEDGRSLYPLNGPQHLFCSPPASL